MCSVFPSDPLSVLPDTPLIQLHAISENLDFHSLQLIYKWLNFNLYCTPTATRLQSRPNCTLEKSVEIPYNLDSGNRFLSLSKCRILHGRLPTIIHVWRKLLSNQYQRRFQVFKSSNVALNGQLGAFTNFDWDVQYNGDKYEVLVLRFPCSSKLLPYGSKPLHFTPIDWWCSNAGNSASNWFFCWESIVAKRSSRNLSWLFLL